MTKGILKLGAATLAFAFPHLAAAQEAQPDAASDTQSAQPPVANVGEIVVTAQRRAERLQDVPISIVAQTGDDLARANVTNIRDLGVAVPGLTFTTQGTFAQPSIRGVQTTLSQAGADSPIAIYLDGFYQPNQVGNVFDLPDIERIEVLKGPQGTLFGRNATGGAIAVHTIEPSYDTKGKVTVQSGFFFGDHAKTANEIMARGYITTPIVDDVLAISVAGYFDHINGYLTNMLDGSRAGRKRSHLIRAKLRFDPAEGVRFLLAGTIGRTRDASAAATQPLHGLSSAAAVNPETGLPVYPDAVVPVEPWHVASELRNGVSPSRSSNKSISLRSEFDIGDAGTLTSLTGYTVVKAGTTADVDSAYAPSCLAVFGCIIYDLNYGPTKTFQQELSFASEKFGAFSFVAGAFLYRDSHSISSDVNPPLSDEGRVIGRGVVFNDAKIKTTAYAAFGELNWDITDSLHAIGGLRYSWERKTGSGSLQGGPEFAFGGRPSWDSWTPRVSLRYDVSDTANVYATFSKGFKSGVLDSTGLTDVVADPETLTAYEVGTKISTRMFSLNVAAFYYDYKDLQVQFFDGTRTLLANAANARLYGVEGDTTIQLGDNFQVRAAGSWLPHAKYRDFPGGVDFILPLGPAGLTQQVVDASGYRMLKAPKFTGSLSVNYERMMDSGAKVDGNVNVYHSSSYRWNLNGRVSTGGFTTLGAQIGYTPPNSGFRFSVFGKNLTNEVYIGGTILGANADGVVYSPPRQVGVSVDLAF